MANPDSRKLLRPLLEKLRRKDLIFLLKHLFADLRPKTVSFVFAAGKMQFPQLPSALMPDSKIIPFVGSNAGIAKSASAGGPVRSDMRSDLVEKASAVVPDPPVLVNMVSRRVRQLNNGRPPLVRRPERLGQADVALLEIIEGKIVLAADGAVVERPAAPVEKVAEPAPEGEQS